MLEVRGIQIKRARGLLGLTQRQLSNAIGISTGSLRSWESAGSEPPSAHSKALTALLRYFTNNGVQFSGTNGVHFEDKLIVAA